MTWEYEEQAQIEGFQYICGVDEAGRGPFAGPVCAAAVILPFGAVIDGLNDSKKLSESKRETVFTMIQEQAVAYAAVMVDERIIDEINILQATYRAMTAAVRELSVPADFAYIDGNQIPPALTIPSRAVVRGDAIIPSVAAASIIAKVTRDRFMREMDKQYPVYGFAKHKGYGTKTHIQALLTYGACPIHRKTFLRKFYQRYPDAPRSDK